MRQTASLHDLRLDMLLPASPCILVRPNMRPIKPLQMMRFMGEHWELFGPIFAGHTTSDELKRRCALASSPLRLGSFGRPDDALSGDAR
jgi:hypothetical protein